MTTNGLQELFQAYCYIFDPAGVEGWWKDIQILIQEKEEKQRDFDHCLYVHWKCHWGKDEKADISVLDPVSNTVRNTDRHCMTKSILPCHGECFFRASNVQYGLCPPIARKDDVIVVLKGEDFPFLLRPVDTNGSAGHRYRLVGECFLNGYMQGEGLNHKLPIEVLEII